MLYYQGLLYVFEIIKIKIIGWYYNNFLARHFEIKKTRELGDQKFISRLFVGTFRPMSKDVTSV